MDAVRKERRGFASMSREKQREIASKGGRAAHEVRRAPLLSPRVHRGADAVGKGNAEVTAPR